MKNVFLILLLFSVVASAQVQTPSIIPQPVSVQTSPGSFIISRNTVIAARDEEDRKAARFFNDYLQNVYGFRLDIDRQESKDYIRISTRKFIKAPEKDAYQLTVDRNGITIEGDTYAGSFYGIQTLIQLLPLTTANTQKLSIPFVTVSDYPRFNYRGMHLDVARHFFPPSFVKKYIDFLALHKLNYFHWHLTDDQGWRIEIKKYPELMQKGAWRNGTIIGRYPGIANDNIRYGGYFTQEEVKDIIQYAAERHITIIPEIEMPGHASAAIASYPWLSCFPEEETIIPSHPSEASKLLKGKKVQETWGVFEDVFCAGKDSTFLFLQGVMDEVVALFPSPYIHVGGDECPKVNWKRCAACQLRMKTQGLKNEHELQSYFVQRMEQYLNSKGKTIIGWDEILEGGLAPNAVVMSWRGEKGGIEAARQQHKAIMTPEKPLYFDHSQTRNEDSIVIGGFNPLEAVYAYDPIPKELDTSAARYIMGAQANLWTEYIKYPSKVEYKVFPRMSALSEVVWSPAEKRNWKNFEKKLKDQFKRYDLWKVNYSKAYYDIRVSIQPAKNYQGLSIAAAANANTGQIRYKTSRDAAFKTYKNRITVNNNDSIQFHFTKNNRTLNQLVLNIRFNKATGKKVSISKKPNEKYPGQGAFSLVNGIYSAKGLSYPDWLGWIGDDMEATIDLGKVQSFDSVRMHTLDQNGSWVYLPQYVEVLVSADGKKYRSAGRSSSFIKDTLTMGWINVAFDKPQKARYIKVVAKNYGIIPSGRPGAGFRAWLFADEIQVL